MDHCLIITNNSDVYERYKEGIRILYLQDQTPRKVLEKARDMIHMGSRLLSHPMAGSIAPNQMPYRSLLLWEACLESSKVDGNSLKLIENSLDALGNPNAGWSCEIKQDYRVIDMSIISDSLRKIGVRCHC
jgi:hypothetical protein